MKRNDLLPLEPFLAIIDQAIREQGTLEHVICELEGTRLREGPRAIENSAFHRRIRSWRRGEDASITLALADRIVTRLLGPEAWHTRPELAALYERAA